MFTTRHLICFVFVRTLNHTTEYTHGDVLKVALGADCFGVWLWCPQPLLACIGTLTVTKLHKVRTDPHTHLCDPAVPKPYVLIALVRFQVQTTRLEIAVYFGSHEFMWTPRGAYILTSTELNRLPGIIECLSRQCRCAFVVRLWTCI